MNRSGAFVLGYVLGGAAVSRYFRRFQNVSPFPPPPPSSGFAPGEVGHLELVGNVVERPDGMVVARIRVSVGETRLDLDCTAETLDTTAAWYGAAASAVRSAQIARLP